MATFRIKISKLSEGEHRYPFEADAADLGLNEEFHGKVSAEAILQKSPRQVFLRVVAEANATFQCDRCLDSFEKHLKTGYEILYITENQPDGEPDDRTEVQVISPDTNYLDLDDDVRQYLVLSVPQKLLCSNECQGLCPTCGKNKNHEPCVCPTESLDSRWDALKALKKN